MMRMLAFQRTNELTKLLLSDVIITMTTMTMTMCIKKSRCALFSACTRFLKSGAVLGSTGSTLRRIFKIGRNFQNPAQYWALLGSTMRRISEIQASPAGPQKQPKKPTEDTT